MVEARVVALLKPRLYQLELDNGFQLKAFAPQRLEWDGDPAGVGDRVVVELTPFDLSHGRLVGRAMVKQ